MNQLFTFLLLLLPFLSYSQQNMKVFFDESWQISSSKFSRYYVCECFVLESGAYEGPFTCYTIDSEVLVKSYNFSDNILDGEMKEFYENGAKKLHAYYNRGLPVNEWKEWDIDGNLVVDKTFDENSVILKDKRKMTDYEKMYFGEKEFEAPVYLTECILKKNEKEKYRCSDAAMLEYYKHPPLPPNYFDDARYSNQSIVVFLKYQLSEKGKVTDTKIIETSGDAFLDELAQIHVLNMLPFEAAKQYENPIKHWIEAEIIFNFTK